MIRSTAGTGKRGARISARQERLFSTTAGLRSNHGHGKHTGPPVGRSPCAIAQASHPREPSDLRRPLPYCLGFIGRFGGIDPLISACARSPTCRASDRAATRATVAPGPNRTRLNRLTMMPRAAPPCALGRSARTARLTLSMIESLAYCASACSMLLASPSHRGGAKCLHQFILQRPRASQYISMAACSRSTPGSPRSSSVRISNRRLNRRHWFVSRAPSGERAIQAPPRARVAAFKSASRPAAMTSITRIFFTAGVCNLTGRPSA